MLRASVLGRDGAPAGGGMWAEVRCLRMCINDRAWLWEGRLRGGVTAEPQKRSLVVFLVRSEFSALCVRRPG